MGRARGTLPPALDRGSHASRKDRQLRPIAQRHLHPDCLGRASPPPIFQRPSHTSREYRGRAQYGCYMPHVLGYKPGASTSVPHPFHALCEKGGKPKCRWGSSWYPTLAAEKNRKDGARSESVGRGIGLAMEVVEQPVECLPIGGRVRPIAEIGDMELTNLAGRVLANIGIEILPFPYRLKGAKADGKQDLSLLLDLPLARDGDLRPHPLARHAGRRKDEQQLVIDANGFVNLPVDLFPALQFVRGEPAADAFGLQIIMKALGKLLVVG